MKNVSRARRGAAVSKTSATPKTRIGATRTRSVALRSRQDRSAGTATRARKTRQPGHVVALDHVNLVTADIVAMSRFYTEILGLTPGWRPPFPVDGQWLYCDGTAVVHLVDRSIRPAGGDIQIEHFALRGRGLASFLALLRTRRHRYRVDIVPDVELRSVNVWDPDGNHIEVLFTADEQADLAPFNPD